ncbi:MAG TPA: CotH kinase family protein [Polyangiales bacterium]|nr:CotH kinase family protein [Polyangiales bacterium]
MLSRHAEWVLSFFMFVVAMLLLPVGCSSDKTQGDIKPSKSYGDAGPSETADASDSTPAADAAEPLADAAVSVATDAATDDPERDAATTTSDAEVPPAADSGATPPAAGSGNENPPDAGTQPPANDDARLFATDSLLEIELTLSAPDWDLIRGQGRSLNEVFSYCLDPAFDYTVVPASIRAGGHDLAQIGLRKKGFIGSLSIHRPSLHIDVAEYVKGQLLFGAKTITLNNSLQDTSYTHTCMAYQVFAAAGVPAPRCSFARVVVNGVDLGVYLNVEPIKKPFLARQFGDDSGNLYEGSGLTDFRSDMLVNFEKKTNEDQPLSPQISQLAEVLARPGDDILADVEALVDMDRFLKFWATEVLIAHWDGYTGDLNNFYLYVHPITNKLVFIPWGTDAAFEHTHPYLRKEPRPQSVYAWSRLPNRLYAIEQSRERFRTTLRNLLTSVWSEAALLAEVDRIAALLGDRADPSELTAQRNFLINRRAELMQELDGPAPQWTIADRPPLMCQPERNSAVTGSFNTTWGNLSAYSPSAMNVLDVVLDGTRQTFSGVFASAGLDGDGVPTVQVGALLPDGRLVAARFFLSEVPSGPAEVALHGFETYGAVVRGKNESEYALDGFVSAGKLVFDRASLASGAALSGHFEAQLITLEPALAAQYGKP